MRRKGIFYSILISAACVFLPFFLGNAAKNGAGKEDLKEISKPYTGVYRCKEIKYGACDFLQYVKKAELELKENGGYVLTATMKNGKKQKSTGRYETDGDKISFVSDEDKSGLRREFSFVKGELAGTGMLHGKTLYVVFSRG